MGAFFDSILVRTEDSALIRRVLEQLSKEADCKFLLGPPIKGWINVFPREIGRKELISARIARLVPHDIFHLMVHDDDIFYYYFYRGGKLADRYNSCPDYFEEVSESERQDVKGRPEHFQDLLSNLKSLNKFQKLLADDKFTFESERMADFAELLSLPNALGSYKYLQSDTDGDDIEGWGKFVHIENQPVSAEEYNSRGAVRLAQEDLDGALADFNKAIELNPGLIAARENLGHVELARSDRNKTLAETWNKYGRIKKENGDPERALFAYNQAIELNPNYAVAYSNRGMVKKMKGDLAGALADYDKSIELRPDSAMVYNNRGLVKKAKSDLDGALVDFNKAIELEPDLAAAFTNRGDAKRAAGDFDGALADYNKSIELKPDSSAAYNNRSQLKRVKKDFDGALTDCNKAIELNPDSALYFSNRSLIKLNKRDLEGALTDSNRAIELKPDLAVAYNNRGMVKQIKNDLDSALEDYNKAINLKPDLEEFRINRDQAQKIKENQAR